MNVSISTQPIKAAWHPRQHGQGMVEFLLAAAPVLLISLSSIEAIHWYFVRQAVSLALSQAARAAITQHADPTVLDAAFARALLPLYAAPSRADSHARLHRAMTRREHSTGLPAWKIYIVSPATATFDDFSSNSPDLPRTGKPVIDNDYLHEQDQARAQGRGPLSGQNTLEANTLILDLTWLHEPLLPGVKQLLRQIVPTDSRYGSQAMARAGFLPLRRQVALMMQSHPIAWDMPAHGRVQRAAHPAEPEPGHAAHAPWANGPGAQSPAPPGGGLPPAGLAPANGPGAAQPASPACEGLWCLREYLEDAAPSEDSNADGQKPHTGVTQPAGPPGAADDAYLDPDADTEPDDCPSCCP